METIKKTILRKIIKEEIDHFEAASEIISTIVNSLNKQLKVLKRTQKAEITKQISKLGLKGIDKRDVLADVVENFDQTWEDALSDDAKAAALGGLS